MNNYFVFVHIWINLYTNEKSVILVTMREQMPEQLSIFDILTDLKKPEAFYMPDSFNTKIRGTEGKADAFENVRYIGVEDIPDKMYTVYIRKVVKESGTKYLVSVPNIEFTFGYNTLEKLLSEWDINKNDLT